MLATLGTRQPRAVVHFGVAMLGRWDMKFEQAFMGARVLAAGVWLLGSGCGSDAGDSTTVEQEGSAAEESAQSGTQCAVIVGGHCIKDALQDECGLDTGYEGDIMCLQPPSADEGFQMHLGPTEYTEEGMRDYVLPPGEEGTRCIWVTTDNDSVVTYYERVVHMRPVSHHLITSIMPATSMPADYEGGWASCGSTRQRTGSLGGSETVRQLYPANGIYPPEFADVGRALPSTSVIRIEMHYLNATDMDLLREMWMNVYYKPQEAIEDWVADVNVIGGLASATPPGAHTVMLNTHRISTDARIVSIFGHYHAHTTRFSVWHRKAAGEELVYEDFDWFDPATLNYDSLTVNPEPDRDLLIPGGHTGILDFEPGDEMYWECEVVNESDSILYFANEAFTGEMCNVFGEYIGGGGLATASYPGREMPYDEYLEGQ